MRTIRMQIAYDGAAYFGWQRQDGFLSVQEAIEHALLDLLGQVVTVHGSGRTDTGVHALRQVAHCQLDSALDDDRLRHALNFRLGGSCVIGRLETCRADFHARFDAVGKRYGYRVETGRFRPPMGRTTFHWIRNPLRLEPMRDAASRLVGTHDFKAFSNAGSVRHTTVRTIHGVRIIARANRLGFVVQGNGFLYNMVRTIAGTLLDVGRGRLKPEQVDVALKSTIREDAGITAPAEGLYLIRVLYDEPTFSGRDRSSKGVPGAFQY
ncbi:MAG: tRNA pseudouridine(38-40) synthase TruA [Planctomycetota bacterium]|nr:tRNA pseudouridine(38-40) synthase TruA [Planctomycetota bacterium]